MTWTGGWFGPESTISFAGAGERSSRTSDFGLTPSALIQSARDRSPLFDPVNHLDGSLLRALTGEERRLVGKALLLNPSSIAATLTIVIADYSFSAGQALPAFHHIETVDAIPSDASVLPFPLIQVAWANRAYMKGVSGYSIHGGTFYLAGASSDWTGIDQIDVTYAPIPVDLTTLDDRLVLPDTAESALVAFLAHFMARRVPADQMPVEELAGFAAERAAAERDFLAEMERTRASSPFAGGAV